MHPISMQPFSDPWAQIQCDTIQYNATHLHKRAWQSRVTMSRSPRPITLGATASLWVWVSMHGVLD
jgi:hypothetical protein